MGQFGERPWSCSEQQNFVRKLNKQLTALRSGGVFQSSVIVQPSVNFIELLDVQQSYEAAGNFGVRVKSTEDGLEFAEFKGTTNQVSIAKNAAGYTWSLPQDIHSGASPTFVTVKLSALTDGYVPYHVSDGAGLANSPIRTDGTLVGVGMAPVTAQLEVNTSQIITSTAAAPYLKIINLSNTERDPVIQWAVGATPIITHTVGIDDSDYNSFKIAVGSALGVAFGLYGAYPNEYYVGDVLRITGGSVYEEYVLDTGATFYGWFRAGETLHESATTEVRLYAYKLGVEWAHIYVGELDEASQISICSNDFLLLQAHSINSGERVPESGCGWYHSGSFFIGHAAAHSDVLGFRSSDGELAYLNFKAPVVAAEADVTWTLPATDSTGIQALVSDGAGNLSWASLAGGVVNFPDLADAPASYVDAGGFFVKVKVAEDGLEFIEAFDGLTKVTVGTTEPTTPAVGDLWIDTN